MEQAAFHNTDMLLFSSNWGIREFEKYYISKKQKPILRVVYRGANIKGIPTLHDLISNRINCNEKCINLLMLISPGGWKRKEGDKAIEIATRLNQEGFSSNLNVFGDVPEQIKKSCPDYIKIGPYLRKYLPEEEMILKHQLLITDFLLLPTQADFTPNVICEANAFGIPVLSTDINAIPEMITDGINGFLFPVDASAEDYSNKIIQLMSDRTGYFELRKNSRQQYETKLNWETSCKQAASYIQDMISSFSNDFSIK